MARIELVFRAFGLVFILFGLFAIGGSILLWGEGFYFTFSKDLDLAIPTADIFVNGPASILTGIGLWRMRKWGYAMAWFTAGLYMYGSVEIFVWAFQDGKLTPEIVIPQSLAVATALFVMVISWKGKDKFL